MGTAEQSSQTSKSGGLEHNDELQKVSLWCFSKAEVQSGSWGWEESSGRKEHRLLSLLGFLVVYPHMKSIQVMHPKFYLLVLPSKTEASAGFSDPQSLVIHCKTQL